MKKRTIISLLLLLVCVAILVAETAETTVYVTRTGKKYHREGCSSLSKSKIPMTLGDAVAAGYEPCGRCHPPELDTESAPGPETIPVQDRDSLYQVNTAGLSLSSEADVSKMVMAEVIEHVDGDTVRVRIANPPDELHAVETIRMLGVDTPETVHPSKPVEYFGKEASEFTRKSLLGKTAYLAFDWDLRDRYDRLLAYIYTDSRVCFNVVLIQSGYAHAYVQYPFQFIDEFTQAERKAREEKQGLWKE